MKISVIIPTYRPGNYLWQCLNSILTQSFNHSEYEVIIVLNGCDEPWRTQIRDHIKGNGGGSTRLLQTNIGGVSNARNLGLECAMGEYITFLDDDDFVTPDYLAELYSCAGKQTVAISNTLMFMDEINPVPVSYHITATFNRIKQKGLVSINQARSYFSGPGMKMIHREIIGNRRFKDALTNGEDTLFMFEISDRIKTVRVANESAVYYRRIREGSATTKTRSNMEKRQSDVIQLKWTVKIFFSRPFKYNLFFFFSRVFGCIRYILWPK